MKFASSPRQLLQKALRTSSDVAQASVIPILRKVLSRVHPELEDLSLSLHRFEGSLQNPGIFSSRWDLHIVVRHSQLEFVRVLAQRAVGLRKRFPWLHYVEIYSREEYAQATSLIRNLGEIHRHLEEIRRAPTQKAFSGETFTRMARSLAPWIAAKFQEELEFARTHLDQPTSSNLARVRVNSRYLGFAIRFQDGQHTGCLSLSAPEALILLSLLPETWALTDGLHGNIEKMRAGSPRLEQLRLDLTEVERLVAQARTRGYLQN